MKPTPIEWLIASRYTLLVWVGLALYFFYSHGGDWAAFSPDQQTAIVIIGVVFALAYLKSFPTVYFFEREQAIYAKSAISPEERWRRSTVKQMLFLALLAIALLYFGLQWWKTTPEPQPTQTRAVLGIGGASVLATTAYLKVRAWRSSPVPEQPAIVSWCQPVATDSPNEEQIASHLPDYCQRILAAGDVGSPAHASPIHPQVKS